MVFARSLGLAGACWGWGDGYRGPGAQKPITVNMGYTSCLQMSVGRITRQCVHRETTTFQDQVPRWAAEASSAVDCRKGHFKEVFWDPIGTVVSV